MKHCRAITRRPSLAGQNIDLLFIIDILIAISDKKAITGT